MQAVVTRSFEAIVASEAALQAHDREHLRDQTTTVFLRQGSNYGLNRFLGILVCSFPSSGVPGLMMRVQREDIFPLIENEGLIKFRINFLRTKTWTGDALAEYYTVALKYERDGSYGLDIWRAGTGKQHVATTDSQLWNLGDYLSRLPTWTGC